MFAGFAESVWRGKVTAVKLRIEPRQRPMMMLTEGGQG